MSTIIVGTPVTAGLGALFGTHGLSKKVVVLFDEHTRKLYGDELLNTLTHEGFLCKELVVPAREASKISLPMPQYWDPGPGNTNAFMSAIVQING